MLPRVDVVFLRWSTGSCVVILSVRRSALFVRHTSPSESATDVFVAVRGGSHEPVLWCDRAKRGFTRRHEPCVTPSVRKRMPGMAHCPVLPSIRATLGTLVPSPPWSWLTGPTRQWGCA
jgi:hypothetical protein